MSPGLAALQLSFHANAVCRSASAVLVHINQSSVSPSHLKKDSVNRCLAADSISSCGSPQNTPASDEEVDAGPGTSRKPCRSRPRSRLDDRNCIFQRCCPSRAWGASLCSRGCRDSTICPRLRPATACFANSRRWETLSWSMWTRRHVSPLRERRRRAFPSPCQRRHDYGIVRWHFRATVRVPMQRSIHL